MIGHYVARMEGGEMVYFAGFAPGGKISTGDKAHAVLFNQGSTAERFMCELNDRDKERPWFRVDLLED